MLFSTCCSGWLRSVKQQWFCILFTSPLSIHLLLKKKRYVTFLRLSVQCALRVLFVYLSAETLGALCNFLLYCFFFHYLLLFMCDTYDFWPQHTRLQIWSALCVIYLCCSSLMIKYMRVCCDGTYIARRLAITASALCKDMKWHRVGRTFDKRRLGWHMKYDTINYSIPCCIAH